MRRLFTIIPNHGTQLGTVKDKTEIEEAVEQVPDALDTNVNVSVDPESGRYVYEVVKFLGDYGHGRDSCR